MAVVNSCWSCLPRGPFPFYFIITSSSSEASRLVGLSIKVLSPPVTKWVGMWPQQGQSGTLCDTEAHLVCHKSWEDHCCLDPGVSGLPSCLRLGCSTFSSVAIPCSYNIFHFYLPKIATVPFCWCKPKNSGWVKESKYVSCCGKPILFLMRRDGTYESPQLSTLFHWLGCVL